MDNNNSPLKQTTSEPNDNKPSQHASASKTSNKFKVLFIVGSIFLVLTSISTIYFIFKPNSISNDLQSGKGKKFDTVVENTQVAEEGKLYLVDSCEGEDCISNSLYWKRNEDGQSLYRAWSNYSQFGIEPYNFSQLENIKLIGIDRNIISVSGFGEDYTNKDSFYVSLLLEGEEDRNEYVAIIVQINKEGEVVSELLSMSEQKLRKDYGGERIKIVTPMSEKHMLLDIYSATHPGPENIMILNTETLEMKYLGKVSIRQDFPEIYFSYKKLAQFKEPCRDEVSCDENGEMTVYRPSGDYIFDQLP